MDFSIFSVVELLDIKAQIEQLIQEKQPLKVETEYIALSYNSFKGTGKAWIAAVDERTKKVEHFLDCDNNEKSGYKGVKHFYVPLKEGAVYCFNSEGSKSYDSKDYKKVVDGVLVAL